MDTTPIPLLANPYAQILPDGVFGLLGERDLDGIEAYSTLGTAIPRQLILWPNTPRRRIALIKSGVACSYIRQAGEWTAVEVLARGDLVGEAETLFASEQPLMVVATTTVEFDLFQGDAFLSMIRHYPVFAEAVVTHHAARCAWLMQDRAAAAGLPHPARFVQVLAELHDVFAASGVPGGQIPLHHADLRGLTGIPATEIGPLSRQLQQRGVLTTTPDGLSVVDIERVRPSEKTPSDRDHDRTTAQGSM